MANNGSGQYIYTFTPKFQETATLYAGLTRVWIGDGSNGEFGYLYAEYSTGRIQNLGLASEYGLAKQYFEDLGKDINYEQWIEILVNTPDNAQTSIESKNTAIEKASEANTFANEAESWAVGKRNNVDVETTDPAYHNNSKYYSEIAYQHAESIKGVNLVISYQNSTSGTIVPTGTWSTTPSPIKGQYLWTRTVYNWADSSSSTSYTVTYIGVDGRGDVESVNGKTGHVVLHASDITMSQSDDTSVFDMLQIATISEIDALFN